MLDLRTTILQGNVAQSEDELLSWAVAIWAKPDNELQGLAERYRDAQSDPDPDVSRAAAYLLDAVETALEGDVPLVETMRQAGRAMTAVKQRAAEARGGKW